jgi:PAS domain S-box-containing protein
MENKMNILLIEDNPADSRLIDIYLKESFNDGFSLVVADSLLTGLEEISKNKFDIIIIDLSLPDSSGINTFKEVFKAASEIPLIVLTGNEDESVGMDTVKLGAQEFLIKGKIGNAALKRSINYSIERYKLLKALSENAKKIEEKTEDLLKEKLKLAQAQKLAHIGSWELNVKDNIFTCSDELYHIFGLMPNEIHVTYEKFLNFVYPEERSFVMIMIEESIKKLQPFDFFHRIIRTDNAIRMLHARGELLVDEQGNILRMIGTAQDVTRQKKDEELEQLAMVAAKSINAVTIADRDGHIEWVNEGFTRLFGYKLNDVKGTYGEVLRKGESTGLSPETDYYKIIFKEKKPLSYENKNYAKDGSEYWVLTSLTPILDQKGNMEKIISIDTDITRQKKAEKVKEQFLTNMSHEIRTPMNAIIGFTNLLLKSQLTKENKQYLKAIKASGENLLVIINDILDYSKLESGKATFESIAFSLSQLVTMFAELMHPKAEEKNIKLTTEIDEEIPEYLVGDPTRLTQILINLAGNAIKFTNKGEVKIIVSIINQTENEIELDFSVIDTGIGIPEESLAKIFESFTQASNDTTRKYGGTGLGLSITKQLIELQGGVISVSSVVDKGSSFRFNLKFKKEVIADHTSSKVEKESTYEFPMKGLRILLVEDNSFNQILASKILENWKCVVEIAANGKIAVEKARKKIYDIILMDIQLPEMDGYEATQTIRNKIPRPNSDVPIIAMTAHAFSNEVDKCLQSGMNDYISKPFNEVTLKEKMLNALQKFHQEDNRV